MLWSTAGVRCLLLRWKTVQNMTVIIIIIIIIGDVTLHLLGFGYIGARPETSVDKDVCLSAMHVFSAAQRHRRVVAVNPWLCTYTYTNVCTTFNGQLPHELSQSLIKGWRCALCALPVFYQNPSESYVRCISHSVICHPAQTNAPQVNPSQQSWYSIYLPRRDERLSRSVRCTKMVDPFADIHLWR